MNVGDPSTALRPLSASAALRMTSLFQSYPGSTLQYAHSLLITILNPAGEIVFQQAGVGNAQEDAVATLQQLVTRKAREKR